VPAHGSFNHGRVLFVGDAAHQVSPFGARGANSGLQDADNLGWKLKLVLDGQAPDSGCSTATREERVFAADENLLNSTRSTDFITPKSRVSRTFRNAVLSLARDHAFARALVNSGRLSVPAFLVDSRAQHARRSCRRLHRPHVPGAPMDDAPVLAGDAPGWLLNHVGGSFRLMLFVDVPPRSGRCHRGHGAARLGRRSGSGRWCWRARPARCRKASTCWSMPGALATQRYDARPGTVYLLRPDQHVAARWRRFDAARIDSALARATCKEKT
jgi:3-(3-hydroxy-phenyl)propionate hydroxylase